MNIWFTADTHFNHTNIINICKRPFQNVEEMDSAMIVGWNKVVSPDDVVYHLGDFAFRHDEGRAASIFSSLNGKKHLIAGNHDRDDVLSLPWSSPPERMVETKVDGIRLVLCHYGMRVWPGNRRGALHLYGHSHGRLPGTSTSLDVGVDCWGFRPVSLTEIRQRLATLPDVNPEVDSVGWP